ncbi:hypothetical protein BDV23DRAFT_176305 [Aspergillus alliaceus]|uniref:PrpF protein-domain-containing protein n=1 Tax=Petromyces alliaceus TaxID=209559 RepID=A0A5N7BU54_PETAA|nr:hypothetical protein BDV23DRAFT_176305 [Aspergillus alliaceus]
MPGILKHVSHASSSIRRGLLAAWVRADTSKGLFIHEHDLPPSKGLGVPILVSALGSAEAEKRQLNGIRVDVDYTLVQVAPDQAQVDMNGSCGNMTSGFGPFALDEELVDIRVFKSNTQQLLVETVHPGGSMTGRLFPSGAKQEMPTVNSAHTPTPFMIRASLVNARNPFVFVDSSSMPSVYCDAEPASSTSLRIIEEICIAGAMRFGLTRDTAMASQVRGTPKIALLSPGRCEADTEGYAQEPDIVVLPFSMRKPHPSLQLTGAVSLGTALSILGTWLFKHPSGLMDVETKLEMHRSRQRSVKSARHP